MRSELDESGLDENSIKQLINEHVQIINLVGEIKKMEISSNNLTGTLSGLKNYLVEHFKRENAVFYPTIKKQAENNSAIKQNFSKFINEMKEVSKSTLGFLEKYEKAGSTQEFSGDYENFCAALTKRMKNEEKLLYLAYQKILLSQV